MFKKIITAVAIVALSSTVAFGQVANSNSTSGASADSMQMQSQGTTLEDVGNIKDSFNSEPADLSEGRGFAIPGDVQYGPTINYFGEARPSDAFQPVEQLIMYSCWFTEGALESMLKGVERAKAEFKLANARIVNAAPASEDGTTRWIKIVVSRDKYEGAGKVGFKGFVTARSEHRNTTSTEVMARAALVAVQNGANVIHFTAQGAMRDVEASGWGIGLSNTNAQVYSSNNTHSNVASGGMGYSRATAGMRDKPWLQGFALVDNGLVYPELAVPYAIEEEKVVKKAKVETTEGNQVVADVKPQTGNHTSHGSLQ
jgi:hypothetical protein